MKHVKKFEHFTGFDLGRFSEEEGTGPEFTEIENVEDKEDCVPCGTEESDEDEDEDDFTQKTTDEYESEDENDMRRKVWGDEITVERIATFRQFEAKKAKPDFLDLDKDGNKKESMKKAAKDAKEDKKDNKKEDKKDNKKEEKGGKGLTAAQKKLPEGLRKAIEAKNKK
jgi:hypothetical protein